MHEGSIPWFDAQISRQTGINRKLGLYARDRMVEIYYYGLRKSHRKQIETRLTNRTTAISAAANVLSNLKNRRSRFPNIDFADLSFTQRGVIATEYDLGPTNTSARNASASDYGKTVTLLTRSLEMKLVLGIKSVAPDPVSVSGGTSSVHNNKFKQQIAGQIEENQKNMSYNDIRENVNKP
jgi:hypothetical protein